MKVFTLFLLTSGLSYALTIVPRSSNHGLIHQHVERAGQIEEPAAGPELEGHPPPVPEVDPHKFTHPQGGSPEVPASPVEFHDAVMEQTNYDTAEYAAKDNVNPNGMETAVREEEVRSGENKLTISVIEVADDFEDTRRSGESFTELVPDMENAQYIPASFEDPDEQQRVQHRRDLLDDKVIQMLDQLDRLESGSGNDPESAPRQPSTGVYNTQQNEINRGPARDHQVQAKRFSIFSWRFGRGAPTVNKDNPKGDTLPTHEYLSPQFPYGTGFKKVDPKLQPWFEKAWKVFDDFVSDNPRKRRRSLRPHPLKRRQSVITTVEGQEGITATGAQSATFQLQADFELYLSMFNVAQANVSEVIWPILAEVIDSTNSTLIHEAALSVYSDLTASAPIVLGPFSRGSNCLTWLEDRYINSSGITNMSDPRIVKMFATDQIVLEAYEYMWTNASAAANKTGLLSDMVTLSQKLSPTNSSNMPSGYASYYATPFDISYFVNTNTTANPKNGTTR